MDKHFFSDSESPDTESGEEEYDFFGTIDTIKKIINKKVLTDNDLGDYELLLNEVLDTIDMDDDLMDFILVDLLTIAYVSELKTIVKMTIDIFEKNNINAGTRPVLTQFFRADNSNFTSFTPDQKISMYRFIASVMKSRTVAELLLTLANFPSDPRTLSAFEMIENCYVTQPVELYQSILIDIGNGGKKNHLIFDCIKTKIDEISEYAPIPKLIPSDKTDIELKDYADSIKPEIDTDINLTWGELATMMMLDQQFEPVQIHTTLSERYINLVKSFNLLDEKDYKTLVIDYLSTKASLMLGNNREIIKIYGPSNPRIDSRNSSFSYLNSNCSLYGGCHMLLCEGHEPRIEVTDVLENNSTPDWFTGNCNYCQRKIRERHMAVRMPMDQGGWYGCYCKWKHVFKELEPKEVVLKLLTTVFSEKYEKYGIYDRIVDTVIPEYDNVNSEDYENLEDVSDSVEEY